MYKAMTRMHIKTLLVWLIHGQIGCGSVVFDSLFYVAPIVCRGSLFGICFVMHYLVFSLAVQSS